MQQFLKGVIKIKTAKKNGREIKCKTVSGMIENGSWERSHCNVFSWQEIKEFFENQFKIKI